MPAAMPAAHPILPGFYPDPATCRVGADFAGLKSPDGSCAPTIRYRARWLRHRIVVAAKTVRWLAEGVVRSIGPEVAGGYNGVVLGPYATARGKAGSSASAHFDRFYHRPLRP